MNRPGNNTSHKRNSKTYWKAHRAALLLAPFVGLALVVTLVLVLNGSKNDTSTDQSTNSNQTSQQSPKPEPDPTPATPQATGTVITTGDSEFGTMLFDEKNQAIYIWEVEESTTPECYGDCAEAWPPVLTDGKPQAAEGVEQSLLGTTERNDGSTQVTYNGHPLYYYAHEGPGEVKCHNVSTHGGLWWVIQPNGNRAS